MSFRNWIGIAAALGLLVWAGQGFAADDDVKQAAVNAPGKAALPVPRFVSLKSDKVNVRRGPSTDQAIVWVFSRAGLPVEIIAESENWRRVLTGAAQTDAGRPPSAPNPNWTGNG